MCGVFGAVVPPGSGTEAATVAALGLFALQHRGQESAGVAVSDGEQLMLYKDLGMIASVLDERRLPSLRGGLAIAHCRYSTTGSTIWENAQPTFRLGPRRALALLARQHGLTVEQLGTVGGDRLVVELAGAGATGAAEERGSRVADALDVPLSELRHAWETGLSRALGWEGR